MSNIRDQLELNTQVCLDVNERLFQRAELAAADELLTEDFVDHEAHRGSPVGPEGAKWTVGFIHGAFDDVHYEVHDHLAQDDRVVLRLTMHGTHTRPFMGNEPTGRSFAVQHLHVFRVRDGQVCEHWACRDDLGMLRQLGLA